MFKINEIFHSIQGEGFWAGTPMTFIRMSGCNLKCDFCDTNHKKHRLMTTEAVLEAVMKLDCRRVCFTGGEPTLQPVENIIERLTKLGYVIHIETNGTLELPFVHWATISPKSFNGKAVEKIYCDEIKIVYTGQSLEEIAQISSNYQTSLRYIQPAYYKNDVKKTQKMINGAIKIVKACEPWKLSMQIQKFGNFK